MFYIFSQKDEGKYMAYSESNVRPKGAKEYRVNINGDEVIAGISNDTIYVNSASKVDKDALIVFVKHFILKFSEYEWWLRNAPRMSLFENSNVVPTV